MVTSTLSTVGLTPFVVEVVTVKSVLKIGASCRVQLAIS